MRIVAEDNVATTFRRLNKRLTRLGKTSKMPLRRLLLAAVVAALCFGALPSVASATPCWKRVITDWTKDGQINGHYSPECLREAYKKTPTDLADYSGILDDINAALIATSASHTTGGGKGGSGGGGPTMGANGSSPAAKAAAAKRAKAAKRAVPGAGTPASAPGRDRSIPLPLILLAAVIAGGALAGAAPPLYKRYRGRFPRLRPSTGSVRPPA
jgi:hypothetical protein